MMTTGAMVLGAIPLALAKGAGRREPPADRLGHCRRHVAGHAADDLRGPTMYTLLARRHAPGAKKEPAVHHDAAGTPLPHRDLVVE
jgi:multidrug efflux pump